MAKVKKTTKKVVAKKTVAKKTVAKKTTAAPETLTVDQLLKKLSTTTDSGEKRKIRVRLRKLGHKGGLRKEDKKK